MVNLDLKNPKHPLLRSVVILGAPLTLGTLDIFHPNPYSPGQSILQALSPKVNWWLFLHFIQLPLFCLLALAAYLLLHNVQNGAATVSRISLGIFIIFYPAFDAITGIGTGILIRYAISLPPPQHAFLGTVIDVFWKSPFASILAGVGTLGWGIGILALALALTHQRWFHWLFFCLGVISILVGVSGYVQGRLTPVWIGLIGMLATAIFFSLTTRRFRLIIGSLLLAAFFFSLSHAFPFGPIGMLFFFLAALQLELFRRMAPSTSVKQKASVTAMPNNVSTGRP